MAGFLKSAYLAWAVVLLNLAANASGAAVPVQNELDKRSNNLFLSLDFSIVRTPKASGDGGTTQGKTLDSVSATLENGKIDYLTDIYIGSDEQQVQVLVDTGSSDLWVASKSAGGTFDKSTSTSYKDLNQQFEDLYGDGSLVSGEWSTDDVTLTKGTSQLTGLQFGYATQSTAEGIAGILGIGLEGLESTVYGGDGSTYPNFPALLKEQGFINKNAYSLYLNTFDAASGTILFGAVDNAKYSGSLVALPLTGEDNVNADNQRLDVTLQSLSADGQSKTVGLPVNLDSGTTYTYLPQDVVRFLTNIFNPTYSPFYGTVISCDQPDEYVEFNFDGVTIKVPYSDFADQAYDTNLQPISGVCAFAIQTSSEEYILGDNFLRHAYIVYDLDDRQISLAQVKYTDETDITTL